jgi:acetyltransferase-like isoleucine patch superfamily enzyme
VFQFGQRNIAASDPENLPVSRGIDNETPMRLVVDEVCKCHGVRWSMISFDHLVFRVPRGALSRVRLLVYRALGMRQGKRNRMEGGGRVRRCRQISIGNYNAFTQGCWLWPEDTDNSGIRICIGNSNFFNRNVMVDSCGYIEIGDQNMFGPDVYMTDSNHQFGRDLAPSELPMDRGTVIIGSRCWVGAKAVILKGARLGNGCVVAAGAVVNCAVEPGQVVAGVPARPIGAAPKVAPGEALCLPRAS